MGVRGLSTYINKRSGQYLESFQLRDSYLVIDGNCVLSYIYCHYVHCNCAFGGDYDKFAKCVSDFFDELAKCNVIPLVIFDGGIEKKKIPTILSRRQEAIYNAVSFTPESQFNKKLFPLFIANVFVDILNQKGIKNATTKFEADSAIAAVARALNCPVLSNDSDFFIFGSFYIPMSTLEKGIVKLRGTARYAKSCKIYKIKNFLSSFKEQDMRLPALFAMLLGNDYVKQSAFKNFFAYLNSRRGRSMECNPEQRCINATLSWLQETTFDDALTSILSRIPINNRQKIVDVIEMVINGYLESPIHLLIPLGVPNKHYEHSVTSTSQKFKYNGDITKLEYIDEAVDKPGFDTYDENHNDDNINDSDDEVAQLRLPDWVTEEYIKGNLPKYLMSIRMYKLYICSTQMEDFSHPPAILICEKILRVMCALMIPCHERKHCCVQYVGRGNDAELTYYQLNCNSNTFLSRLPSLSKLRKIPLSARKQILNKTLEINESFMSDIPFNWQLYMGCLIFWIKQQKNLSTIICHIYSLLFCMFFHIVDNKIGYYRTTEEFERRYIRTLTMMKNKEQCQMTNTANNTIIEAYESIKKDDCLLAAPFLISNFHMDKKIFLKQSEFRVSIVHMFAEFQNVLKHSIYLNMLLGFPYEHPRVADMYNGTLLYNLVENFSKFEDIDSHISAILRQSPNLLQLFNALLRKVKSFIIPKNFRPVEWAVICNRNEKIPNINNDDKNCAT